MHDRRKPDQPFGERNIHPERVPGELFEKSILPVLQIVCRHYLVAGIGFIDVGGQLSADDHILVGSAFDPFAKQRRRKKGADQNQHSHDRQLPAAVKHHRDQTDGTACGYYLGSPRSFQLPELKLLVDAVLSSRYLTEKKSKELIEKLCAQCNAHDAALMKRNVLVSGRVKSMNETILINVDTIQEAITQNKAIKFRYFDWDLGGVRRYREKEYLASPYGLCQDHENCYLLAYSARHGITSYRVDRMTHIELTEDKRTPCPELTGKALHEHANRLFQMYSGDQTDVKMRFHRDLVNVVVDRFGKDIMLIPDGEDHFNFTVKVAVSPMFLSWIIGFGCKAQILYPQQVIDKCAALCKECLSQYEG